MKTVLVASSKGGVGKTTLSTNLAAHFANDGKRTVLVDADRQGSSRHWAEKRATLEHAVLPALADAELSFAVALTRLTLDDIARRAEALSR